MAHMWFGDLVTMRWWDDLWLNETFASYASELALASATRFTQNWTTFAHAEKAWASRQDQLPTTHPIVADVPDVRSAHLNFDGITYAKGASAIRQLVAWVGLERFLEGMRRYFRRHEYGNAELHDFLAALEETSGRDLVAWSKVWLESPGITTLRAEPRSPRRADPSDPSSSPRRRTGPTRCSARIASPSASTTRGTGGSIGDAASSWTWWAIARRCLTWWGRRSRRS